MAPYIPVRPTQPPPPPRSRWWWLRYWVPAAWLCGVVGIAGAWRMIDPGLGWRYAALIVVMASVLYAAALLPLMRAG